ncbi:hypothetical protein EC973_007453 [Apophysomyces ossiformis]|uniref:SWIRM domain-containing protein n=1 Tax=Apophysomyces ossiformis TaxID=679940 RepID=A0A8H7BP71_9FUNG|nr:hypothetical protein EC973_007453 [Apophysomyces ossiformis]
MVRSHRRRKTVPHRSYPPATPGAFTMNFFIRTRTEKTEIAATTTKKAKTTAAAAYDQVDVTVDDALVFDKAWVPSVQVFENRPGVRIVWKGSPLAIQSFPYYNKLHPSEVSIASTLRLTPEQYLKCKRTLVLAAQESAKARRAFRKSDAQKLCRIDVNKVSLLWSVFNRLGWLGPK